MDGGTTDAREPPTATGRPCAPVAGRGCDMRAGSRDRRCERLAPLPLRRVEVGEVFCVVASIILTMGRGEAMMEERVDPRRAEVAQVGESEV